MPTNDERREVAEIMRDGTRFSVSSCAVAARLGFDCEEYESCAMCEYELAYRLADLIEPEPVSVANIIFTAEQQEELFQRVMEEFRVNVNLTEAVDAICGQMCGDGWDWRMRAETVVRTIAEMCGAKVVSD